MSAERISAGAAIAAAVIALAALALTYHQARNAARQTELQRQIVEDSAQPNVWADLRLDPRQGHLLQFVVMNEGPTVATDEVLDIDPPLKADWMKEPNEPHGPHQQRNRFASIPPGRQMVWHVAVIFDVFQSDGPHAFAVTITSNGPYGPVEPQTYVLDLNDYRGVAATAPGTLLEIKKSIDELTAATKEQRVDDT